MVHAGLPEQEGRPGLALEIVRAWQYCLFVFVAVMGLVQLVAIVNGLKGMLFIRNKPVTVLLSAAAVVFAFWWFFYRDDRVNTAMRRTGLEGAQQFTVFCWTTFAALVVTLVLASLISRLVYRRAAESDPEERTEGAYQLKYVSWFEALREAVRRRGEGDAGTHHPG